MKDETVCSIVHDVPCGTLTHKHTCSISCVSWHLNQLGVGGEHTRRATMFLIKKKKRYTWIYAFPLSCCMLYAYLHTCVKRNQVWWNLVLSHHYDPAPGEIMREVITEHTLSSALAFLPFLLDCHLTFENTHLPPTADHVPSVSNALTSSDFYSFTSECSWGMLANQKHDTVQQN